MGSGAAWRSGYAAALEQVGLGGDFDKFAHLLWQNRFIISRRATPESGCTFISTNTEGDRDDAFTSTTVNNTTLAQAATIDYGGAGTQNLTLPRYNFRTGTGTFSGHPPWPLFAGATLRLGRFGSLEARW